MTVSINQTNYTIQCFTEITFRLSWKRSISLIRQEIKVHYILGGLSVRICTLKCLSILIIVITLIIKFNLLSN
jgi:hypothetical protein